MVYVTVQKFHRLIVCNLSIQLTRVVRVCQQRVRASWTVFYASHLDFRRSVMSGHWGGTRGPL